MEINMVNYATPQSSLHQLLGSAPEAFGNAAVLLAGKKGKQLVDDIVEALARNTKPDRRTLRNLVQLHRILSLDAIDEDPEAQGRFLMIAPTDPVVEEICLLSDSLLDALSVYASLHPSIDLDLAA
ncbi:hypothetical protein [Maritimibacter dapengensis]|uniref:Uncharacterized protein n=1 Tax=Maritimibacter dapengensis TaxID=2836868 RepID=A0ABS6T7U9_9RHOB|nr:hypothetical protein [Maritimibacter dapengensis]MBV7380581.1 hypothetical protein [Maritimibacter dapengensis]